MIKLNSIYTVSSHKSRCMLLYIHSYTHTHTHTHSLSLVTNCGVCFSLSLCMYVYTLSLSLSLSSHKLRCMLLGTVRTFISIFLSSKPTTGGASRSYLNCFCLLMTTDMCWVCSVYCSFCGRITTTNFSVLL